MAILTKPEMTEKRIAEVQEVVAQNPGMTRSQLSILICDQWEWCSPTGQRKDIAAREMLRGLDKAGLIKLPPPKNLNQSSGRSRSVIHLTHDMNLIECELSDLMPLQMHIPVSGNELAEFKSYIAQFHYLGLDRTIGENMKYVIKAKDGRPLACLLFGSAAWSCRDRDNYIGWDKNARRQNLYMLTGNTRFLIFPWIRVSCLASKILSMAIRRLSSDWEIRYGHPLAAVETFVERRRFRGVCYKAANWLFVGSTTGRGRDGGHKHAILPEKDIYLYLLNRRHFERLKEICP
jgi:hypothetical protein